MWYWFTLKRSFWARFLVFEIVKARGGSIWFYALEWKHKRAWKGEATRFPGANWPLFSFNTPVWIWRLFDFKPVSSRRFCNLADFTACHGDIFCLGLWRVLGPQWLLFQRKFFSLPVSVFAEMARRNIFSSGDVFYGSWRLVETPGLMQKCRRCSVGGAEAFSQIVERKSFCAVCRL